MVQSISKNIEALKELDKYRKFLLKLSSKDFRLKEQARVDAIRKKRRADDRSDQHTQVSKKDDYLADPTQESINFDEPWL